MQMASNLGNQYAPPKSAVADVADEETSQLASRFVRLVAVTVDGLLGFIAFTPAYVTSFRQIAQHAQQLRGNPLAIWMAMANSGGWFYLGVAGALIVLIVDLILLARNGQTIGKKLLGIKVVRVDGSPVTLFRVFFLRYVVNTLITMIPLLGSIYALADSLMIFGEKRRMIHDRIADTIVIKA
jgi:uncharacterized RDD family membrane protein YckC